MINIQKNIPLAEHTTFRIGGPAKFFVEAKSKNELIEALQYANKNNLKYFVFGGGSNLLVSDQGFDGLAIKMRNTEHEISGDVIECGSGMILAAVVKYASDSGLSGMEWAIGIPGTVGGAVLGNAGAFGGDMASVVESVEVLDISDDSFKIKKYDLKECSFSYRNSVFKNEGNLVILSVVLRLRIGNKDDIQKTTNEILLKRISKQPKGWSAGSFFVNPVVSDEKLLAEFEKETEMKAREGKLPAGWLIEKVGLSGKKIGGAVVSEDHANFILNIENAKAEDVVMLASLIKQQVRDKLGIQLMEEVRMIGF